MGKIFKIEAVAQGKAADDLPTALLKAGVGDVLDVPQVAINLTVAGGMVEIKREDAR